MLVGFDDLTPLVGHNLLKHLPFTPFQERTTLSTDLPSYMISFLSELKKLCRIICE